MLWVLVSKLPLPPCDLSQLAFFLVTHASCGTKGGASAIAKAGEIDSIKGYLAKAKRRFDLYYSKKIYLPGEVL